MRTTNISCDHCGNTAEDYNAGLTTVNVTRVDSTGKQMEDRNYDLCKLCAKLLREFLQPSRLTSQ